MSARRDAAQHGSRRMRQLGCDCFPCRLAESRYKHLWRSGGGARIPVATIRRHLAKLEASGWTRREIQHAAGLGNNTIWHLTSGRQKTVNSRTANEILSLQPHGTVPADLTRLARQIGRRHGVKPAQVLSRTNDPAGVAARHELMWLLRRAGWTCGAVGAALHRAPSTISHVTNDLEEDPPTDLLELLDEVPDPAELAAGEQRSEVDDPACESCGAPPMGGGKWCYPCYLDNRGKAVAE